MNEVAVVLRMNLYKQLFKQKLRHLYSIGRYYDKLLEISRTIAFLANYRKLCILDGRLPIDYSEFRDIHTVLHNITIY